jgi:hypothetical protein
MKLNKAKNKWYSRWFIASALKMAIEANNKIMFREMRSHNHNKVRKKIKEDLFIYWYRAYVLSITTSFINTYVLIHIKVEVKI